MCDKAADNFLLVLKFISDWFVTSKMIEKGDSAVFSNDYIVFGDLGFNFVTFFSSDVCLNSITIHNTNLDYVNFGYCDPENITINIKKLKLWLGIINKYKQCKESKNR